MVDITSILDTVRTTLGNQFVAGGVVLGLIGTLIATAKQWPIRLWKWVSSKVIVGVYIHNDDTTFKWLSAWLDNHPYSKRARTITATSEYSPDEDTEILLFTPAPGNHVLWVGKRLFWLHREREQGEKRTQFGGSKTKETFFLGTFSRSQKPIRKLLEEAKKIYDQHSAKEAYIHIASYGNWVRVGRTTKRSLDSVILPGDIKENLVTDLERFRENEERYFQLGIPYRRGYLLHGVPGSGKTSLITALAAKFNYNLYLINLGNKMLSDDSLAGLIHSMDENSILLFEDVDCAQAVHERSDDKDSAPKDGISLSGLLNSIDGLMARDGTIVFMTTNHRDRLDPALIRPGRCDVHIEFGRANFNMARAMFDRFFPEAYYSISDAFASAASEACVAMATIQEILTANHEDPQSALEAAQLLIKPNNVSIPSNNGTISTTTQLNPDHTQNPRRKKKARISGTGNMGSSGSP